jgi:polysaccharide biosynthesis/export protein
MNIKILVQKNSRLAFYICLFLASSCVNHKKIPYFKDVPDSASTYKVQEYMYSEPVIQPDDILAISIQTIDPQTSSVLNQLSPAMPTVGTSSASTIGAQVSTGFLVDKEGQVELPIIGKIKLEGLSTFQAREVIRKKIALYFKNPTVLVRFTNYKITILGEVAKPGTYTLPNEKVTVLDVIGLAGDLTIYGKRYNILVIREKGNNREFVRLDLNSSDIFKSPYFYLKQNDILYIEPNKAKVATTNVARTQTIALILSTLSFLIVFLRYRPQ